MNAREKVIKNDIIPAQIRAGRALVGLTQDDLASASGLPKRTIARIELAEVSPRQSTIDAIRTALEAAGVKFIGETGVRLVGPATHALREREVEKQRQREAEDPYIPEVKFTSRDGIDLEAPSAPPPSSPKGKEK